MQSKKGWNISPHIKQQQPTFNLYYFSLPPGCSCRFAPVDAEGQFCLTRKKTRRSFFFFASPFLDAGMFWHVKTISWDHSCHNFQIRTNTGFVALHRFLSALDLFSVVRLYMLFLCHRTKFNGRGRMEICLAWPAAFCNQRLFSQSALETHVAICKNVFLVTITDQVINCPYVVVGGAWQI